MCVRRAKFLSNKCDCCCSCDRRPLPLDSGWLIVVSWVAGRQGSKLGGVCLDTQAPRHALPAALPCHTPCSTPLTYGNINSHRRYHYQHTQSGLGQQRRQRAQLNAYLLKTLTLKQSTNPYQSICFQVFRLFQEVTGLGLFETNRKNGKNIPVIDFWSFTIPYHTIFIFIGLKTATFTLFNYYVDRSSKL